MSDPGRIEELLGEIERLADPVARERCREAVAAVLDLHRAGFERLRGLLDERGEAGRALADACVRDPLVGGLMLLHGVHPVDVEGRARAAAEAAAHAAGATVEIVSVADGVVRARVGSRAARRALEQALVEAVPDAAAIEIEGGDAAGDGEPTGAPRDGGFVPLERLRVGAAR
jgi:hypothetical protein